MSLKSGIACGKLGKKLIFCYIGEIISIKNSLNKATNEGITPVYSGSALGDWSLAIDFGSLMVSGAVRRKVSRRPFWTCTVSERRSEAAPADKAKVFGDCPRANRLEV